MSGSIERSWRCFVGLPLPGEWREALDRVTARLAKRLASRITWTKPGNWHLTLKFLGDVDFSRLPDIAAALSAIAFEPFALTLGAAGQFSRRDSPTGRNAPKALWAGLAKGAEGATRLAAGVDQALAGLGFAAEARPFRAHVTLGRVKDAGRDATQGEDWGIVAEELLREGLGTARAERFVLWRSILGPEGPKYVALNEFPARPPATTAG